MSKARGHTGAGSKSSRGRQTTAASRRSSARSTRVSASRKSTRKKASSRSKGSKGSRTARGKNAGVAAAVKRINKLMAQRRSGAWGRFNDRLDADLDRAMNALAGYDATPQLGELKARTGNRHGRLAASYDAASADTANARHWANADALGAVAANSPSVRSILRKRARYEIANNCYGRGIVLTRANDLVGRGPRIQFNTDSRTGDRAGAKASTKQIDRFLEVAFTRWARAVRLASKMRTAAAVKTTDGEAFLMFTNNAGLRDPIKLDVRLIEAEQIADPVGTLPDRRHVDGIVFDDDGNPVRYLLLRSHPGENGLTAGPGKPQEVPADDMVHWFRCDRPGQVRGIPEITPALPLFAQLRRFTLATLDAAEAAADFAVLLYTELPPMGESGVVEASAVSPMSSIDLERRMMTAVPAGWKAAQMKAEHPATTYGMFKTALINEVGRCINMPYGVAAANSSDYNFASGRLDLLPYRKSLELEQADLEAEFLDRLVDKWLDEALTYYGIHYPAFSVLDRRNISWSFVWDSVGYGVNPVDEANAQQTRLASHTTTLAAEYASQGKDWEVELRQRAKEIELMGELGLFVDLRPEAFSDPSKQQGQPESDQNKQDAESDAKRQEKKKAEEEAARKKERQSNAA